MARIPSGASGTIMAEPNRDRWYKQRGIPDFSPHTRSIADALIQGDMSLIESLLNKTNEELFDLRGFPFSAVSQTEEDKRTRLGKYNRQIHTEPLILTDLSFEGYDFSEALLGETTWIDCRFSHCTFSNLRFLCSRFVGCKFHRTDFIDCHNDAILLDLGRDKRCEFDECEFIRGEFEITALYYPSFSKCSFKLDMNTIDFQGSQFSDCTFEGRLNGVTFRGRKDPADRPFLEMGKKSQKIQ